MNIDIRVRHGLIDGLVKVIVTIPDGRFKPTEGVDIPLFREAQICFWGKNAEYDAEQAAAQLRFAFCLNAEVPA